MRRASPIRQRLTAIAIAGAVVFTYPMLGLANGIIGGLPAILVYLFGAWAALIALAALVAERRRE